MKTLNLFSCTGTDALPLLAKDWTKFFREREREKLRTLAMNDQIEAAQ